MRKFLCFILVALSCTFFSINSKAEESGLFVIDLSTATDEQLDMAIEELLLEKRARIKTTIDFDKDEILLAVGKTEKIKATVIDLPEGVKTGKPIWSSTNEEIALCNNGTVKGINPGETTVLCKVILSDGNEIETSIKIRVFVPIKSLSIEKKEIEVEENEIIIPEICIKPENASMITMQYIVADPSIVKVDDNGNLLAIHYGKTKVIATTTDGSKKSITFDVKVNRLIGKYDNEITFYEIPWGSKKGTASSLLKKMGIVSDIGSTGFGPGYVLPVDKNNIITQYFDIHSKGENATPNVKLGGYFADQIALNYISRTDNNADKELIAVSVEYGRFRREENADYFDVLSQLSEKYGEFKLIYNQNLEMDYWLKKAQEYSSDVQIVNIGYPTSTVVLAAVLYGKNNTGIAWIRESDGHQILIYGKTDAFVTINEIEKIEKERQDTTKSIGL